MTSSQFDVIVVGAGAAGLTAALGLARPGFRVAVLETAAFPGAANPTGGVYCCESLAQPDLLGPEGVAKLPWERRLVERGLFATDGHGLLGMTYRDPPAFRDCYTALPPIFAGHLARHARDAGVALFTQTTAESLIRENGSVMGVCTNRGPFYADLVFLAEGGGSGLLTHEGYDRRTDPRDAPHFLLGLHQILDLPAGVVEERFSVGPKEGAAHEILVRNATLGGRELPLNLRASVCTNRDSLSVGLVLPAANLHKHFNGDPRLLLDWFIGLPALQGWLRDGKRGPHVVRTIRCGARDIPMLIDDGLAIGGDAASVATDFPYRNDTGPAMAMGLLLSRAATAIRAEGGRFTKENLRRHYLEPLQQTHSWRDTRFLRRWPGYVRQTHVLFGRDLDLALGTAYLWTRPDRWLGSKWFSWLGMLWQVAGPTHWQGLRSDLREIVRALRLREAAGRPAPTRLFLDGTLNALRDLFHRRRTGLPPAGAIQLHFSVRGGAEPVGLPPWMVRRWFGRFRNVLAAAAGRVLANEEVPLALKLADAARLFLRQVNLFDVLAVSCLGFAAGLGSAAVAGLRRLRGLFPRQPAKGLYERYAQQAREAADLSPTLASAAQQHAARNDQSGGMLSFISAPALPDPWAAAVEQAATPLREHVPAPVNGRHGHEIGEWYALCDQIDHSLEAFDANLGAGASEQGEQLEALAHQTQQLAGRLVEALGAGAWAESRDAGICAVHRRLRELATALAEKAEQRGRRAWDRHYAWAAADGRQLRQHHLAGLRRFLALLDLVPGVAVPGGRLHSALWAGVQVRPLRSGRLTRYPIVFCHGMLAMSTLRMQLPEDLNCFAPLREFLRERGYRALFPQVSPTAGIVERARQLREQILKWTDEPINLVAHSMGGLDCRYLITHLGLAERVRSLTTVSTAHRGTYLADWFCTHFRQRVPLLRAMEALGTNVDGFSDCRQEPCREFNARTPDMPGVRYFSYGGEVSQARLSPLLRRAWNILTPVEGPNDGMVSLASARWGEYLGTLHVDHFAQTPDAVFVRPGENFDSVGFFTRLVEDLAWRGF